MTSGSLDVNGSNQFPLSPSQLTFSSGSIDIPQSQRPRPSQWESNRLSTKADALSGNGTLGTLSQSGIVFETLLIPMNSSISHPVDPLTPTTIIDLTLTGQLFGKYLIPASNGDYNQNGFVDAADYAVWRTSIGQTGVGLAADGNGDNRYRRLPDYNCVAVEIRPGRRQRLFR